MFRSIDIPGATLHIDPQGKRVMRLTVDVGATAKTGDHTVDILGTASPFMFVLRAPMRPDAVLALRGVVEEAVHAYLRETAL